MLYHLSLHFQHQDKIWKSDTYYHILWAVMNIFVNDKKIYDSIIKISYRPVTSDTFVIMLTIWDQSWYNQIITQCSKLEKNTITLHGIPVTLTSINLLHKIRDPDQTISYFDKIQIRFHSPTWINQNGKNMYLPVAKNILINPLIKLQKLGYIWQIPENISKYIDTNYITTEFDIHTQLITIKWWIRCGVVWTISYNRMSDYDNVYDQMIWLGVTSMWYVWIWWWSKLGLWNTTWQLIVWQKTKQIKA